MIVKDHRLIDQRSLAFGQAIADRITEDPRGIDHAKANIAARALGSPEYPQNDERMAGRRSRARWRTCIEQ